MTKMETITSAANPLVKDVRRAVARGGLTDDGCCVAETFHLLEEALRSGCDVRAVLVAESMASRVTGVKPVALPDALLRSMAGTESSPGVIALVKPREWTLEDLLRGRPLIVVLDELQDPGNAGAIVRTAEAFGATGAIFVRGTASPHNPKTLRASAGSLFRLPVLHGMDGAVAREALRGRGVELIVSVPARPGEPACPPSEVDMTGACALIIGNEARGVTGDLSAGARRVSIPTVGVESLNAAVAAGILLYESRRQRAIQP
ncbi:MAG TPA: RNA methyltransferase [Candidatus Sulfopaludibacter sp.]|nr:RNA methyltransferase [Candidatus Sulfopaludibacter sp.]